MGFIEVEVMPADKFGFPAIKSAKGERLNTEYEISDEFPFRDIITSCNFFCKHIFFIFPQYLSETNECSLAWIIYSGRDDQTQYRVFTQTGFVIVIYRKYRSYVLSVIFFLFWIVQWENRLFVTLLHGRVQPGIYLWLYSYP